MTSPSHGGALTRTPRTRTRGYARLTSWLGSLALALAAQDHQQRLDVGRQGLFLAERRLHALLDGAQIQRDAGHWGRSPRARPPSVSRNMTVPHGVEPARRGPSNIHGGITLGSTS